MERLEQYLVDLKERMSNLEKLIQVARSRDDKVSIAYFTGKQETLKLIISELTVIIMKDNEYRVYRHDN